MIIQKYNARSPVLGELSAGLRGLFANQCPLSGGSAVFTARSLYYLIDPNMVYDDRNLCLQQGIILREQGENTANKFNVFPNPATNEVTIVFSLSKDDMAVFRMFDSIGRLLKSESLNSIATQLKLDVSEYDNGVYYYQILVNNKQEENGKLVITR